MNKEQRRVYDYLEENGCQTIPEIVEGINHKASLNKHNVTVMLSANLGKYFINRGNLWFAKPDIDEEDD